MTTYDAAIPASDPQREASAVALYRWNARIAGALLSPLHVCEVVVRNAVSEAVEQVYGPRWPWSDGFLQSLPNPPKNAGYNPQRDLVMSRSQPSTGKVIPELKFVFWQKMFTSRHDARLWTPHLRDLFPNHGSDSTVGALRTRIYDDLEVIRRLRNRIAHHEPTFSRDLDSDMAMIIDLVQLRSPTTAAWIQELESAMELLA
jgi:hypothetical protein